MYFINNRFIYHIGCIFFVFYFFFVILKEIRQIHFIFEYSKLATKEIKNSDSSVNLSSSNKLNVSLYSVLKKYKK